MVKLASQQVGKCGELLVQYMLLKYGVESAPLTTDFGIDLVAFRADNKKPISIQVKTCTYHEKVDKWVEWWVSNDCPADYIAVVDLERDKCWIFNFENEYKQRASKSGEGCRLWWSLPGYESEGSLHKEELFKDYEIEAAIPAVFGLK